MMGVFAVYVFTGACLTTMYVHDGFLRRPCGKPFGVVSLLALALFWPVVTYKVLRVHG